MSSLGFGKFLDAMPRIQYFECSYGLESIINGQNLMKLMTGRNLIHLDISSTVDVSEETWSRITQHSNEGLFANLRYLTVKDPPRFVMHDFISHLSQLQRLSLQVYDEVKSKSFNPKADIASPISWCANLLELDIATGFPYHGPFQADDSETLLEVLGKGCPALKSLDMAVKHSRPYAPLPRIPIMANKVTRGAASSHGRDLLKALSFLPNIENITVSHKRCLLTPEEFMGISHRCPRLRTLDLNITTDFRSWRGRGSEYVFGSLRELTITQYESIVSTVSSNRRTDIPTRDAIAHRISEFAARHMPLLHRLEASADPQSRESHDLETSINRILRTRNPSLEGSTSWRVTDALFHMSCHDSEPWYARPQPSRVRVDG